MEKLKLIRLAMVSGVAGVAVMVLAPQKAEARTFADYNGCFECFSSRCNEGNPFGEASCYNPCTPGQQNCAVV